MMSEAASMSQRALILAASDVIIITLKQKEKFKTAYGGPMLQTLIRVDFRPVSRQMLHMMIYMYTDSIPPIYHFDSTDTTPLQKTVVPYSFPNAKGFHLKRGFPMYRTCPIMLRILYAPIRENCKEDSV